MAGLQIRRRLAVSAGVDGAIPRHATHRDVGRVPVTVAVNARGKARAPEAMVTVGSTCTFTLSRPALAKVCANPAISMAYC